jgi:S1-C subfamily serine protease
MVSRVLSSAQRLGFMRRHSAANIKCEMKPRIVLPATLAGVVLMIATEGFTQTGVIRSSPPADTATDRVGGTLEVPPRIGAPQPAPEDQVEPPESSDAVPSSDQIGGPAAPTPGASDNAAAVRLPYLGLAVQYIESNDVPGKEVHGLEVVGVDPNSPAENGGLRARGPLTKLGASGATAGALMAPLDLIVMPLLKKAGKLGADGDLIIAIDDNRVEAENDLKTTLQTLRPGDVIYLTVVRPHLDGMHETLKLPVKLGQPRS